MTKIISIEQAKELFNECKAVARHHIEVDDYTDKLFDGKHVTTFTFLGNGYQVELEG